MGIQDGHSRQSDDARSESDVFRIRERKRQTTSEREKVERYPVSYWKRAKRSRYRCTLHILLAGYHCWFKLLCNVLSCLFVLFFNSPLRESCFYDCRHRKFVCCKLLRWCIAWNVVKCPDVCFTRTEQIMIWNFWGCEGILPGFCQTWLKNTS